MTQPIHQLQNPRGVAADGNQWKQLEILQTHVDKWIEWWAKALYKQLLYSAFLCPQLVYSMGCATIKHKQTKQLFGPVIDALLHSLGLNKKFPLAMVYSGPDDLGLGTNNLPTIHSIAQLQLLLGYLNMGDWTGKNIEIDRNYLELTIGMSTCPLVDLHSTSHDHVPKTWLTSIYTFLAKTQIRVEVQAERVVCHQHVRDVFIMRLALDSHFNLRLIQKCCLYLQVATLANVCDEEGTKIEQWAFHTTGRKIKLHWPTQGHPSQIARAEWKRFLNSLLGNPSWSGGRFLKWCYQMEPWHDTHQHWEWTGNERILQKDNGER